MHGGSRLGVDGRVENDEAFERETLVIEDRWSMGKTVGLRVNNSLHCSKMGRKRGIMYNRTYRLQKGKKTDTCVNIL